MLFPTSAISNSDGTNCASGRGSSWTRGYHLAAICLSDGSPLTPAVQENRILGVFTVLVQPFHLADGKIRHWSKSPRTPVAKPYLLPRPPDLQQELLSHQCLFLPTLLISRLVARGRLSKFQSATDSRIQYLLSTYCVSRTLLGAGGTAENKTGKRIIAIK